MKIKYALTYLTTTVLALNIISCASMFGDNTRQITVNSQPSGARIFLNGNEYGQTPQVISLPTYIYGSQIITLKKPGYNDQSININSEFQLVGLWNILTFPIGFGIDAATGDIVKISPGNLNVNPNLSAR